MEIAFQDWANLILRWVHLIAGIAWIGSSFYFVWLDFSLRKNESISSDVVGENWSVHGGGFYHSQKYMNAPNQMPATLHWFKYEAYSTWISGFCLMAVMYYWSASFYLIDNEKIILKPWEAVSLSITFLVLGWIIYDLTCKSKLGKKTSILAVIVFFFIIGCATLLSKTFSDRAALLHVGAIIGGMMAGNVFFIIIPNQKRAVADLIAGKTPDPSLGAQAKQRSIHNNYLTLPVLLMMISSHYPMLANHNLIPITVGFILLIGGIVRHFFNSFNAGQHRKYLIWQWPTASILTILLILLISYRSPSFTEADQPVSAQVAMKIIQKRCVSCHAQRPINDAFETAAGGLSFESLDGVKKNIKNILDQAVLSRAMPMGNITGMSKRERESLGKWINSELKKD